MHCGTVGGGGVHWGGGGGVGMGGGRGCVWGGGGAGVEGRVGSLAPPPVLKANGDRV